MGYHSIIAVTRPEPLVPARGQGWLQSGSRELQGDENLYLCCALYLDSGCGSTGVKFVNSASYVPRMVLTVSLGEGCGTCAHLCEHNKYVFSDQLQFSCLPICLPRYWGGRSRHPCLALHSILPIGFCIQAYAAPRNEPIQSGGWSCRNGL